jgi:hypothetical protein
MIMRPAIAVLSALLLLTACGDGGTPKATSSPTSAPTPLTAAQAKTVAAAGVLTAADLPGYKAETQTGDPDEVAEAKKLAACLGVTYPEVLASDTGRAFTQGEIELDSYVDVSTSAADARAEYDALATAKGPSCLKTIVSDGFTSLGAAVENVTVTPMPITVSGSDAALAYTFDFKGSTPDGKRLDFHGYSLGALVGQASVKIDVFAVPGQDFPVADATALLTKAVDRVKAAS